MDFLFNINFQFFVVAYLVGGIPFRLLLIRKFANMDNNSLKSLNTENMLLSLKERNLLLYKKLLLSSFILNAIKGIVVLVIAMQFGLSEASLWGIAVLVVISHSMSPYLKFEGSKGIESIVGVMVILLPVEALITLVTWIIIYKFSNNNSISSLISITALSISSYIIHPDMSHAPILIISFILINKNFLYIIFLINRVLIKQKN